MTVCSPEHVPQRPKDAHRWLVPQIGHQIHFCERGAIEAITAVMGYDDVLRLWLVQGATGYFYEVLERDDTATTGLWEYDVCVLGDLEDWLGG